MKECKFCKRPFDEKKVFCPFCGYDPRTDTINPSFKQKAATGVKRLMEKIRESCYISTGVKIFAFIGLAAIIFLTFYKSNFSLKDVMSKLKEAGIVKVEEKKSEESETFNPSTPLIVEGLIWGGEKPQAIINNKIYNIGDVIEGAEVIEISNKGVTLLYKNSRYTLSSPASIYKHD